MRQSTVVPAVFPLIQSSGCSVAGLTPAAFARERGQSLVKLRRGVYTNGVSDEPAETHRTAVRAAMALRTNPVAAGLSAAALMGLPLVGNWPAEPQLLSPGSYGRRRNGVVELARWGGEEVVTAGDLALTSPADTLVEVCRTAPFLTALVMVDAALAIDRFRGTPPLVTIEDVWRSWQNRMPFRGCARASRVIEFARVGVESVLETLSRSTIYELGFPNPVLQHCLSLDEGLGDAYLDLAWPEFRVAGEADGVAKYLRPRYLTELSPEQRIIREKRRDAGIRRQGWTPAHWLWADAWSRDGLRRALCDAGLPIVRRPARLR